MLTNLSDEDLLLPRNMTKREAIDESLDILKTLFKQLEKITNEKDEN